MKAISIQRWGRALRGLGAVIAGATALALAGLPTNGCEQVEQSFQCGVRLGNDPNVARSCDGPNEVCICWTHYCARMQTPDHVPTEANYCPSGFRYRAIPYGPEPVTLLVPMASEEDSGATPSTPIVALEPDLGDCVPPELVDWKVSGTQLCVDSEQAPDLFRKDGGANGQGGTGGTGGAGGRDGGGAGGASTEGSGQSTSTTGGGGAGGGGGMGTGGHGGSP